MVVGVGSDVPARTAPERFRRKFNIRRPFAIYVGRIDENKGCGELFRFFQRYASTFPRGLDLVLVGSAIMPVPEHPRIRHVGFLTDEDKFDAMAASDVLIMPSYFESLSMVALEAWALGRPVLGVDGVEVTVQVAVEHQIAAGRQGAAVPRRKRQGLAHRRVPDAPAIEPAAARGARRSRQGAERKGFESRKSGRRSSRARYPSPTGTGSATGTS